MKTLFEIIGGLGLLAGACVLAVILFAFILALIAVATAPLWVPIVIVMQFVAWIFGIAP